MNSLISTALTVALFGFLFSGCAKPSNEPATQQPADASHAHGEHEHGEDASHSDMEKLKAELAKLSPEDAASAESQLFCPVSGAMLGTMGSPKKVDVSGAAIWICCQHCEESLLADPDKYVAKLKGDHAP